ncbi:protein-disulfide reductase DsbD domain-containing protein [Brucella endophytica]|nr:protein-disulfide reductase DsbD domain-containing protein [Brucella endophytica]
MKNSFILLALLLAVFFAPSVGFAASSPFVEAAGGKVRLLIDVPEKPEKSLRGAIQIDLADGWKTYWRDPGDAGVPPQFDLSASSNIAGSEIAFPAPQRFPDGTTGYKHSVLLPVSFELDKADAPTRLKGHVFLGLCETICIPMQAEFDLPVKPGDKDALAHTLVTAAFDRLPLPASPEFGILQATRKDGKAIFDVRLPDQDGPAELYITSETLGFAAPKLQGERFSSEILSASDKWAKPAKVEYTLVQGDKAVSGIVELP